MSIMRVTVGMPVYNAEDTLEDAIRSVFAQTFTDWELLIVDDGSTDRSMDIARAIDDPRVKVVSDGPNRGIVYRLNQIAQMAQGQYLARMDADDMMHPERLARQLRWMEMHPDVDVVSSATYVIDGANNIVGCRAMEPLDTSPEAVLRYGLVVHPTVLSTTEWFRRNHYDANYCRSEDHELWCRTFTCSRFAKLDRPLFFYREGARKQWKYLTDYKQTNQSDRRIMRVYGPALIGEHNVRKLVWGCYLRLGIYYIATALGLQKMILVKRNIPLDAMQRQEAQRAMNVIMSTPVPGLSKPAHRS